MFTRTQSSRNARLVLCTALLACSSLSSTEPNKIVGTSLVMLARQLTLNTGDTASIGLTLLRSGEVFERTAPTGTGPAWSQDPPTVWWSSDSSTATVSVSGLVSARLPGSAWLFVRRGDVHDSTAVTVTARMFAAENVTDVTPGGAHTCALVDDGVAWCWGSMWNAATGTGVRLRHGLLVLPTPVATSQRFTNISAGTDHTCALTPSGNVFCWGDNRFGQIGTAALFEATPTQISFALTVVAISAGGDATCALLQDSTARCWGVGFDKSLVYSTSTTDRFAAISVGARHACGRSTSGSIWCWGNNTYGQLGTGDRRPTTQPALITGTLRARQLSVGGDYSCIVDDQALAWCWGSGFSGQLGQADVTVSLIPNRVITSILFAQISAGGGHTCALTALGIVYCWGGNVYGALGTGPSAKADPQYSDLVFTTPTRVLTDVRHRLIDAGGGVTCAIADATRRLDCWGSNTNGQLGIGQISWFGTLRYSVRDVPTSVVRFHP